MAVDYKKLTAAADKLIATAGQLLTITLQGTTTKVTVKGVQISEPSRDVQGTTIQSSSARYLLSPVVKTVPSIGDQLTLPKLQGAYLITSIRAIAPAGTTIYYEVEVAL